MVNTGTNVHDNVLELMSESLSPESTEFITKCQKKLRSINTLIHVLRKKKPKCEVTGSTSVSLVQIFAQFIAAAANASHADSNWTTVVYVVSIT